MDKIVTNTRDKSTNIKTTSSLKTTGTILNNDGFQVACSTMPGIFAILDDNFRIINASERFYIATNATTDILGKNILQIIPPFPENDTENYLSSLDESLKIVASNLAPNDMQLRKNTIIDPSQDDRKEELYISYSNHPVLNDHGELSYIIFKAEDVSKFVLAGVDDACRSSRESSTNTPVQTSHGISLDHREDVNFSPLVLLINTNPEMYSIMHVALKDSYRILQTDNYEEGLKKTHKFNPALIIFNPDFRDQIKSLLMSLRTAKDSINTPVLVIADSGVTNYDAIAKDSLAELIDKPVSPKQIRAHVDKAITKTLRFQIEQSRLAALVTSSEDAILGAKLDGTITDWNSGAERIFGYTQDEIIGKQVQILVPEEISSEKEHIMDRIARGERIQLYETIRQRKDGKRINVSTSISPIRNHQGTIIGASAITRDITLIKKREQEIKGQAFLLEEMGQLAKVGGWEFDPNTGKGAWTNEIARIFEIDPNIVATIGLGLSFFQGEHRKTIDKALKKAVTHGTPYDLELEMISATGRKKWIRTICKPNVEEGKVLSIRGALQDITDIKQAEFKLRDSEKKLNDILEAISDALVVVSEDGKISMVNSATIEMFGYSKNELLGQDIDIFIPEPYKKGHAAKCKSYFISPELHAPLWNKNINIRTRDGVNVPVDIALSLTSIDGCPHAVASIRDISRRRKAEDALKASERKFRAITENLTEMIYRANYKTFAVDYVNKAVENIYGYTPSEWLKEPHLWEKNIHPDDKELVLNIFNKAAQEFKDVKIEYRILDRNGDTHWIYDSMTWEKDGSGNYVAILGAMSDITEQKQATIYLEEHEQFLLDVLNGIKAAILLIDCDKKIIIDVNDEFLNIVGKNKKQVVGNSCFDILNCNTKCAEKDAQGNTIHEFIFRERNSIENVEGKRIPVEESFIPVIVHGQKRIAAVLFDVTEQEALEHQLAYAQKLESIGQLAAGLAHEINTPIQYVAGNIAYLEESFAKVMSLLSFCDRSFKKIENYADQSFLMSWEKEKEKSDLAFLNTDVPDAFKDTLFGVNQVSSIVKAMRKFSHPGSEKKQNINIKETIESIITVSRNEWKYCSEILTDFDPDLQSISCMPGGFNQALLNVIVNAAHANAEAEIKGQKKPITITSRKRGDVAEITVSDTGRGIPAEIQHRIYDPFFTTKEVGKGTGQGLGIVHSVMQKHGGSINFKTEPEKGTTFILLFPIESNEQISSTDK